MDLQKSSAPSEPSVLFTKSVAISSALAIYVFECFLHWRQLRLLRGTDVISDAAVRKAHSWETTSSLWRFIACTQIFALDAVPWLWRLVGAYQTEYLPSLGTEFWKSSLFLLACGLIYIAFERLVFSVKPWWLNNSPTVEPHPIRRWDRVIYDITKGKPMPAVLLTFCFDILLFKAVGWKMQGSPLFFLTMAQINSVIILYPIYLQYRVGQQSPMDSGTLKDAIEESAAEIKFPLKSVNVTTGPLESHVQGVQVLGWPWKSKITIHESMLDNFSDQEIMGLLFSRFGDWKACMSVIFLTFSILFYSNMFTLTLLFLKQRACYNEFGFVDEYPLMAGLVIWAVAMAKPFSTIFSLQRNGLIYKTSFVADKHAADNGYLVELQAALGKIAEAQKETGEVDWMFTLYFNGEPTNLERLARLGNIAREKAEKEDLIVDKTKEVVMA